MTDVAPDPAGTIVGDRLVRTPRQWLTTAVVICLAVFFIIWQRHDELLIYPILLVVFQIQFLRPPSVVSASGITRPWRRRSNVAWTEVESVAAPELGRRGSKLNLTNGKTLLLGDIPANQAQLIAAIGDRKVAATALPSRPAPPARPKNDIEIEADVRRQAAALTVQRRQLAAESRRLRGGRPE